MEIWAPIEGFPQYSVSDQGRVRNDRTDRRLVKFRTGGDHWHVGLMRDGTQHNRAVSRLVAEAFLKKPNDTWTLPTPINLNGDKNDCRSENLMWRPRWFALKYTRQFDVPWAKVDPIRDCETGIVFRDIWDELIMVHGLLYIEIMQAIIHQTYVFPTFQRFEWA